MDPRTLDNVLQSTSDALFPAELGARRVAIDSVDCDGDTPQGRRLRGRGP